MKQTHNITEAQAIALFEQTEYLALYSGLTYEHRNSEGEYMVDARCEIASVPINGVQVALVQFDYSSEWNICFWNVATGRDAYDYCHSRWSYTEAVAMYRKEIADAIKADRWHSKRAWLMDARDEIAALSAEVA